MPEQEATEQPQDNQTPDANPAIEDDTSVQLPEQEATEQADEAIEQDSQLINIEAWADLTDQEETAEPTEPEEDPDLYTIQAADLNAYPELSQQGVQLYQQVPYFSLTVTKWANREKTSTISEAWPRRINAVSGTRITFNG